MHNKHKTYRQYTSVTITIIKIKNISIIPKSSFVPLCHQFSSTPSPRQPLICLLVTVFGLQLLDFCVESFNMYTFVASFFHIECFWYCGMYQQSLFVVDQYFTVLVYHNLFIYLPVDGHLNCFQSLAMMNNAAMNT